MYADESQKIIIIIIILNKQYTCIIIVFFIVHAWYVCIDGVECQQMQRVEMDDWPVFMEPSCDTLFMCFITTFKEGIRAGGGISDVMRKPASHVRMGRGRER